MQSCRDSFLRITSKFVCHQEVYSTREAKRTGVNKRLVEKRAPKNAVDEARDLKLPGVRRGDQSLRAFRPQIRVSDLSFAATGAWGSALCTHNSLGHLVNFSVCCT